MKAVLVEEFGGPEVLALADRPDPVAGPGQAVVEVAAAGVNYKDIYSRQGGAGYGGTLPAVLGDEGAGTVLQVGPGVTKVAAGDRVAWAGVPGSYAQRVAAPVERLVSVPAGVELPVAAALMLQGLTAHYLCRSTFRVSPGDVVVVHAAAGGVGRLLVQLAAHCGAVVVGTSSSPEKRDRVLTAGARVSVDYGDAADAVRVASDGRGAAVVYDGVGKDTFDTSLTLLARRGLMVLYGAASGPVPPFELQRLNWAGSLFVTRPTLADYIATREELTERAAELFGWVLDGSLEVSIAREYPLERAADAHVDLAGRQLSGKLLLRP